MYASTMMAEATAASPEDVETSHIATQIDPLEIDEPAEAAAAEKRPVESKGQQRQQQQRVLPQWLVVLRYWSASTIAVLLAYYCQDTKLRSSGETVETEKLAEVVAVLLLVLVSFSTVHNSNPGYLTADVVEQVCQEDGLTLLGYEHDQQDDAAIPSSSLVIGGNSTATTLKARGARATNDDTLPDFSLALDRPPPLFRGTRRKVCLSCNFAPPLRAHHCRHCSKCVATFDHHCHFIGTCIGERNHFRFYIFLSCQLLGFLTLSDIVGSSKWGLLTLIRNEKGTAASSALVLISKLYLYPLTLSAILVWCAHTFFAFMNMTTFECAKGPQRIDYLSGTKVMDIPFSKGLVGNLTQFCCQRDSVCGLTSAEWKPILWQTPGKIVRDSDDWFENPWQNKYWSCC